MKPVKASSERHKKPHWLKKSLPPGGRITRIERLVQGHALNTVCRGAKCPNQNECFEKGTATFLILGDTCTRGCRFCSIPEKSPAPPDPGEPGRLADAVRAMNLNYAVVTSVTRDDLEDGGAAHFARVIRELKSRVPGIRIEVLVPDFQGCTKALATVLDAGPTVLNHNVETVPSLYRTVRPGADYGRSLALLRAASRNTGIPVKSGVMVGLGEDSESVEATLKDLRSAGVELITIGQYLQPAPLCLDVVEYVTPERFEDYARLARCLGFVGVASGPFVRSSHNAGALFEAYLHQGRSS